MARSRLNKPAKKAILLVTGFLLLFLLYLVPPHKKFFKERAFVYWKDLLKQQDKQNQEQRKTERFGRLYTYTKQIEQFFAKRGNKKDVLVLIPPAAYFKKQGIDYPVPEPGVIYYFTDLKNVSINNNRAIEANWYVRAANKNIIIDSVTSVDALKDTIAALKKY